MAVCLNKFPMITLPRSGTRSIVVVWFSDHDAADHHCSAIVHENLGLGGLRVQSRLAPHADGLINLSLPRHRRPGKPFLPP